MVGVDEGVVFLAEYFLHRLPHALPTNEHDEVKLAVRLSISHEVVVGLVVELNTGNAMLRNVVL